MCSKGVVGVRWLYEVYRWGVRYVDRKGEVG